MTLSEKTVALIGLGQIGGSLGLDLLGGRLARGVVGFDSASGVAEAARELGAIDEAASTLEAAVADADLIVLALPIRALPRELKRLRSAAPGHALFLDLAGTRVEIMRTVSELKLEARYVGAHPLAGSEGVGLDSARMALFREAVFALTAHSDLTPANRTTAENLVHALGGRVVHLTPDQHDAAIALTSHLPHALAISLMRIFAEERADQPLLPELIGGSFRDATRVAASSPELMLDMFISNREELLRVLDRFAGELDDLRKLLAQNEEQGLRDFIDP